MVGQETLKAIFDIWRGITCLRVILLRTLNVENRVQIYFGYIDSVDVDPTQLELRCITVVVIVVGVNIGQQVLFSLTFLG